MDPIFCTYDAVAEAETEFGYDDDYYFLGTDDYFNQGLCSPGCYNGWEGGGICDEACYNYACNFDGGDCDQTSQNNNGD